MSKIHLRSVCIISLPRPRSLVVGRLATPSRPCNPSVVNSAFHRELLRTRSAIACAIACRSGFTRSTGHGRAGQTTYCKYRGISHLCVTCATGSLLEEFIRQYALLETFISSTRMIEELQRFTVGLGILSPRFLWHGQDLEIPGLSAPTDYLQRVSAGH